MFKKVEIYFKKIITGKTKGVIPFLIKLVLLPLSWVYKGVAFLRNRFYDHGWGKRYVPPIPLVISVGNIVAGGTGKTPVTLLLASAFYQKYSVAVLSRGYRSKAERQEIPIALCEGHGPLFPASYCGDEPFLMAQRMPMIHIIVGGNRQQASLFAAKEGAQVVILDDGLQHRQLARDFDIVVVDVADPFGQGYHLPRGFLREGIDSLTRADLIILNHISSSQQFLDHKKVLSEKTTAMFVGTKNEVAAIKTLKGETITSIRGKKVGMFCGIALPERFYKTLEKEGAQILNEWWLPDHEAPSDRALERFAHESFVKGCELLVCTEKDRVKLTQVPSALELPIVWVQMELKVVEGESEWKAFLKRAESKIF